MDGFVDELERRFGEDIDRRDFDWRGDWLIGLGTYNLALARAVLASPVATRLERLFLNCDHDDSFGHSEYLGNAPVAPLDELLAHAPLATIVHARAETIAIGSHDRIETLSLVTRTWPLANAAFPALQRLELCITETAVTHAELATALQYPRLTELVLRGAGFAGLAAELGTFAYPSGLALVVDVAIEPATALALATAPGTLAELRGLELPLKSTANRLALSGLEQRVRLADVARWVVVEPGCFGPIDPALRIWAWETGEEGRSSGWIAFLPRRDATMREADLMRACEANVPGSTAVYADWLEETGELERATAIRTTGLPFRPQSLPEAMAILACAWRRISSGGWIRDRPIGSIDPLRVEDLQSYIDLFTYDEHPLAPDPARAIEPAKFDERVGWLIAMMRGRTPAKLLENEWHVRHDVTTFTPPLGPALAALQLRDVWNDVFLAAETAHGYALVIWGTGA